MPQHKYNNGDCIRVNVRTVVNNDMVRREKRNGRDVIVVRSATLPDNVVMNNILYPAEEIAKSYKSLEGTPAPLGHPTVNGAFVSASHPVGLNLGYFGAYNENVRQENGRVLVDKVIDVERASESKMGQRVLNALDAGEPIHTSTGLLLNLRAHNGDEAEYEGYNMHFDHDAILLDEPGAATPEQGVGMMVNKASDGKGHTVAAINSSIDESIEREIDYLGAELMRAVERKRSSSMWMKMKASIMEAVASLGRYEEQPQLNQEAYDMADEKQMGAINEKLDALATSLATLTETVGTMATTVNTTTEAVNKLTEAATATEKQAREALINKVVTAGLLEADVAKDVPDAALNAMLAKVDQPTGNPAPGINGAYNSNKGSAPSLAEDWEK